MRRPLTDAEVDRFLAEYDHPRDPEQEQRIRRRFDDLVAQRQLPTTGDPEFDALVARMHAIDAAVARSIRRGWAIAVGVIVATVIMWWWVA